MTQENNKALYAVLYHVCCYMKRYQSDIFIDLPNIIDKLEKKEKVTLLFAKSHFDTIDRYKSMDEKDPIGLCQKTLGANYKIELEFVDGNLTYKLECLKENDDDRDLIFESTKLNQLF